MNQISKRWLTAFAAFLFGFSAMSLVGQETDEKELDSKQVVPAEVVNENLVSPRGALTTFFDAVAAQDYDIAVTCLDVSKIDAATLRSKKQPFCDKVYFLLKVIWKIDPLLCPSVTDVRSPFSMDSIIGLVDSTEASQDAATIQLVRNVGGEWKISAESIALVDDTLYDKWNSDDAVAPPGASISFSMWLERLIPETFRKKHFLIKDYQWIALIVLMVVGIVVDILTRSILNFLTNSWFQYVKVRDGFRARPNQWKPVGLLLNALTWYFGATLIDLPASFLAILLIGLKLFAVFASIWTAFSAINLLSEFLLKKAERTKSRFDDLLVPFVRNGLKILAVCVGLVLFVDVFSLHWNSLLGGFGLGGVAIAIASKDVLGNVFGSLTVLTDRPFEIGDWVITEGIEGEVESVGMRSSRIRTFYNSLVVVPNSRMTTAIVDNMGRRHYRRVKAMLGVQYDATVDQLEAFCEGIRELIRQSSETRKDYFHVYVNEFGASSIDILMYFFLTSKNWGDELQEKHKIYLEIMRLAKALKIEFAFPTQTLHVFQGTGPQDPFDFGGDSPSALGIQSARDISRAGSAL